MSLREIFGEFPVEQIPLTDPRCRVAVDKLLPVSAKRRFFPSAGWCSRDNVKAIFDGYDEGPDGHSSSLGVYCGKGPRGRGVVCGLTESDLVFDSPIHAEEIGRRIGPLCEITGTHQHLLETHIHVTCGYKPYEVFREGIAKVISVQAEEQR